MRGKWILRFLKFAAILAVAGLICGILVTHLWNYVMPALFGFHVITFWQAVALMALGRLLFGRFVPRARGMYWRRRMMERWEQMTPEQREKFREGMRGRSGQIRTPEPEPRA